MEFKELFEQTYGQGSFNDEFTITAHSAETLAKRFADASREELARLQAENAALKEAQRWVPASERLPERQANKSYSQVPCLCKWRGEICILVFNHEHECWDQEDGDDYCCDINEVSEYIPLSNFY